jgi:hypothetical protein
VRSKKMRKMTGKTRTLIFVQLTVFSLLAFLGTPAKAENDRGHKGSQSSIEIGTVEFTPNPTIQGEASIPNYYIFSSPPLEASCPSKTPIVIAAYPEPVAVNNGQPPTPLVGWSWVLAPASPPGSGTALSASAPQSYNGYTNLSSDGFRPPIITGGYSGSINLQLPPPPLPPKIRVMVTCAARAE